MMIAFAARAQDLIVLRSGDELAGKVTEITPDLVKYVKASNPNGPIVSINKSEVFMIKYENGTKEVFDETPPAKQPENTGNNSPTVTYSRVEKSREPRDNGIHTLIKYNPLAFFNGDYPFFVEQRFARQLSLEAGIGFTHSDLLAVGFNLNENYSTDIRQAEFGYSLRAGLHFYPSKYVTALEDWYFGPEVHFRQHNLTFKGCEGGGGAGRDEYRRLLDFRLAVGKVNYLTDQVILEWYTAVGIRQRDAYLCNCNGNVVQGPFHRRTTIPMFALGIKLGFGF